VITRRLGAQLYAAWTIPTDAPAGPLLSQARRVPGLGRNINAAILSPSGAQIYVEAQPRPPAGPVILSLHTTSTGSLVRRVAELCPGGPDVVLPLLGLDAAGRHLLAYGFIGRPVKAFDLSSGRHLFSLPVSHPYIEGAFTSFAW
jgi:hypothetical protein